MTVGVIIKFHHKVTTLPPIIKPLPQNFFPRILRDALFSLLEFRENEGKQIVGNKGGRIGDGRLL